jgi:hypothetical protein
MTVPALAQRQPPPDKFRQRGVRLDRQLAGAGPGRRHVPGQRQPAAAQVQHPKRLPGGPGQVDQVPDPPHVLELQVQRIIKVNVGLRDAIHQQRPGPRPVRVTGKLHHPRAGLLPDGRPATAILPM